MPARIEQELDELAVWQEARGVRRKSVLSYASRIRRFAEWFEEERGRHITAANVTDDVLRVYERHLRETCATWTQVVSATSAVRQYNRWAVETGRLPRGKLLRAKVIADRRLMVEKARSSKEFIEGAGEFERWMTGRGRRLSTIQQQIYVLNSMGKFCVAEGRGVLRPELASPELVDQYWNATGRSERLRGQGHTSMHNYVLWAFEAGCIEENTYARFVRERSSATSGRWELVDRETAQGFVEWVAREFGIELRASHQKVGGVGALFRWFYMTRGRMITPSDMDEALLERFRHYLDQSRLPPSQRRPLAGGTINAYMHAARWFLRWAESVSD